MRGRDSFYRFQPILFFLSKVSYLVPHQLANFFFVAFRHMPTKVGLTIRYIGLRRLAKQCGDNVALFEGAYLNSLSNLEIGNHVSIHSLCYLDASGGLKIGSHVSIAHNTTIMTTEHDFSVAHIHTKDMPVIAKPVVIGDDVWIGAGVRILAGVTIGDHVVVGAGAVVTKDIPSHTLAIGVPAQPIRNIKDGNSQ